MVEDRTAAPKPAPEGSPLELVVLSGSELARFPLRGDVLSIGRAPDADVRIDVASVSKRHARIDVGARTIEDLGSANGTTVGGARLGAGEKAPLRPSTVIHLGDVVLVVRPQRDPAEAMPKSVPERSMAAVLRLVDLAAPSDLSLLVLGETGVGKEVVAQAIHDRSPRAKKPFVRINCAAIPEQMLESELFGHEKGAFTGAQARKIGLLEAANHGTILFDEVGELPLGMQAKLLRALDAREILRLGALAPTPIDVRVIASTNRDLATMADDGGFRRDLFYRLDGLTIHVPPLRDRREEIPALAERFATEAAASAGKGAPRPVLSAGARAKLVGHAWPGNVRELRQVVQRALVLSQGGTIDADHVVLSGATAASGPSETDLRGERDRAERRAIEEALAACNGNQTKAAARLGISRRTLIERLDKFGLPRPRKGGA
jgi:transcriptional regulator with PAS, ATPase and Fis domain